jgi:heme oxygenase (mycobilin-producing)
MVKVVLMHTTKDRESSKALIKLIKDIRVVASKQPGFISGETMVDVDDALSIIVISTWKTAEDWKAWDESPARNKTRPLIEELLVKPFTTNIHQEPVIWREDLVNVFD